MAVSDGALALSSEAVTPAAGTTLRLASPRLSIRRHALAARATVASLGVFAGGIALGVLLGALTATIVPTVALTVGLLVYARYVAGGGRAEAGVLEVSAHSLVVERPRSRVTVAGEEVTAGWVVPGLQGAAVEFLRANGDVITGDLSSIEDGHAALSAAGINARKRAVRVLLGGRWDGLGYGLATVLFVLLQGAPMFLLFAILTHLDGTATAALGAGLLTVACLLGARILGPAEVTVGADGVSWKRGFSNGFVPYRELASVDTWHGNDIVLRKRAGSMVLITHSRRDLGRTAGLVDLIRGAMARATGSSYAPLEMLDRGGRPLAEWRAALQALTTGGAYRAVGLTRDDLARALGDPDATPERRMGAALALVTTGDPDDRTRVRVAAEACASETLREALEGIARDDVDESAVARAARKG